MAEVLNVENVNVAEVMSKEGAKEASAKLLAAMEANPAVAKLLEVAESVEDAYKIAKEYITIKFEDFKVLFDKTVDYFKESKVQLDDETMDNVVGGWSWGSFWKEWGKAIVSTVVVVACTACGALAGFGVGGVGGALAGATIGFGVGMALGVATYENLK